MNLKSKKWRPKNLDESFKIAFKGLGIVLKTERTARIILLLGILALGLGVFLKISRVDFMILILVICLVFISEAVNTLVEYILDALIKEENPYARIIKDISAGVVLLSCIFSIIVGWILFKKYLF